VTTVHLIEPKTIGGGKTIKKQQQQFHPTQTQERKWEKGGGGGHLPAPKQKKGQKPTAAKVGYSPPVLLPQRGLLARMGNDVCNILF
jgi:hypothetical protein